MHFRAAKLQFGAAFTPGKRAGSKQVLRLSPFPSSLSLHLVFYWLLNYAFFFVCFVYFALQFRELIVKWKGDGGKMEAIREIREIDSDELVIKLPDEFKEKKVEIIILPLEEPTGKRKRFSRFLKHPIHIENFRMPSREERHAS
jgi:hypothetical protein